ncbi:MAG TPA: exosortase/archaeosortase family protein [Nitrososphaera sp.]
MSKLSLGNGSGSGLEALKNNSSIVIKIVVLLGVAAIVYGSDVSVVFTKALSFSAGNITNYVLVIPMLILFILHRKRKVLLATATWSRREKQSLRLDDVIGAALCAVAVTVYVIGTTTLYSLEYHLLSLPVFIAGGTMLLFNMQTLRHAFMAIVLLAYLQPPPADLLSELAADLSWSSAVVVQYMLSSIGFPITLDASFGAPALVMENSQGAKIPFYVGEPSSGTFSLVGLSVFSLFVAYILRGKLWKRALVFVIGFPVFYILNAVRIAAIISIWYTSGEVAAESFHTVSGVVMSTVGTLILLFFADLVLKLGVRGPARRDVNCPSCEKSLAAGESMCLLCGRPVKPIASRMTSQAISRMALLALIASLVVTGHIAALQNTSGAQVAALSLSHLDISKIEGPETTSFFFPQIDGWDLKYAYRDTRVEKILNQDASLAFRYQSNTTSTGDTTGKPMILTGLQISRTLHTWEGSLLVYPSKFGRPSATVLALEWVDITDDKKGRFFVYQKPGSNATEGVLYWTDKRELYFGSGFEPRNVQIVLWANMDSLSRMGFIDGTTDTEKIKEIFLSLARPINDFWNEVSISSIRARTLDAIVTQRPYIPLGITAVIAAIFSISILSRDSSMYRSNRKLYDQIKVGDEKLLLDGLIGTEKAKKRMVTGEAIVESSPDLFSKSFAPTRLVEMIAQVRNIGLIRDRIFSESDEPRLVWKRNFSIKGDERNGK